MIKRFVIAAVVVGLFLGGVAYFNLVFKPKMIGEFMAKMVPPPATVTAEPAKTERWIDKVRAIGTLAAIEGVDVAPQLDFFGQERGSCLAILGAVVRIRLADGGSELRRPFERGHR